MLRIPGVRASAAGFFQPPQTEPSAISKQQRRPDFRSEGVDPATVFLQFHSHCLIFLWYFPKGMFESLMPMAHWSPTFDGGLGPLVISEEYSSIDLSSPIRKKWDFHIQITLQSHERWNAADSPANCVRTREAAVVIKPLSSPEWKPFPDKYPGSRSLLPCIGVPCVESGKRHFRYCSCPVILHWHHFTDGWEPSTRHSGGEEAWGSHLLFSTNFLFSP